MSGRPWTEKEEDTLRKMALTRAIAKEMALAVNRSTVAVQLRLRILGIKTAQSPLKNSDPMELRRAVWLRRIAPRLVTHGSCDIWLGSKTSHGYGQINLVQRRVGIHRIALELKLGRLLVEGECACHRCNVPACVNFDHIFLGSQKDNMRDALAKGRMRGMFAPGHINRTILAGEQCAHSKLTEAIVREIRKDYVAGLGYRKLAKKYEIHRATARCVVKRTTWAHVE